jgi:predicted nicotinamide N-methyase
MFTYDLLERKLEIAKHKLSLIAVRDTNNLLDRIDVDEFNTDERLPYWAEIWPSSIALSEYLCSKGFYGKSVLELGCGVGVVGIVAALEGAKVMMTDYEEDALKFTRMNIEKNFTQEMLDSLVEVMYLDWRTPTLSEKFDLIVGSDLIYEERNHEPILNLIKQYLREDGEAILTDPNRSTLEKFLMSADQFSFKMSRSESQVQFNAKVTNVATIVLKKR